MSESCLRLPCRRYQCSTSLRSLTNRTTRDTGGGAAGRQPAGRPQERRPSNPLLGN
jgi:hypothetical protein